MNPVDPLKLDNQLCFALYAGSRGVTRLYRPLLDELGLTYPQYLVMLVLWEESPGAINVKALGERLLLDSGTLTPLLKRLEQSGLVERKRSVDDERARLISLTETGQALRTKAECIPSRLLASSSLDVDQLRQLRDQLQQLNKMLRDAEL